MTEPRLIATYFSRVQADLARTTLEAADIPVFLADEVMTRIAWLYVIALGGVRVFVPEILMEDAQAVLRTVFEDRTHAAPDKDPQHEDACPECGSLQTTPPQYQGRLSALSKLLIWLGVPILMWARQFLCERCGCRWRLVAAN